MTVPQPAAWRIPLCDLNYDSREEEAVLAVLRSRWLTMGPRTEEFEARVADYLGVRHAVAVASGTCALELAYAFALRRFREQGGHGHIPAWGIENPYILVPDVTFVATAAAVLAAGAEPALVDIERHDRPLLSAAGTAALAASLGAAAAAVCAVHYAGYDALSDGLDAVVADQRLMLIEDAAHAMGATASDGRKLGTLGLAGCFSFFSNKNLATGEGGLIATNDGDLAGFARLARSHGMTAATYDRHARGAQGYDVVLAGHNYRCTEITAALGLVQLDKLDAANERRRALSRLYRDTLKGTGIAPVFSDDEAIARSACHIMPVLFESGAARDRARDALTAAGIQTSHHYPPIHTFSHYRAMLAASCATGEPDSPRERALLAAGWPAAEDFSTRTLTLPLYPALREEQVAEICAVAADASQRPDTAP
ncbi:MAG: DegT/DnrJ/EryC1/StrS family aminotransferase [Candidatus Sumerlaeaceae bacterium]|nr:DegT/DnrJ/EryC1/StrS family aminotransferase [Candidatus Sumerlaeaceae bacterium]